MTMGASQAASSADGVLSFGPFRLSPRRRLLLEAGKPVRVGSRALDLLIALLEKPGELLSKDELISRAWPTTHVVEGNLKFQIAALRRALRDGHEGRRYLESSPGQGYRFVADVAIESDAAQPKPASVPPAHRHNLPARLTPLIGRDILVAKLTAQLIRERLITIVGPGGIGKTSVAIATAEQLISACQDGVWSVDLGRFDDPVIVRGAVAAAVGININPEAPIDSLIAALRDARMLLVLDNCSHVIDTIAGLVVAILKAAPGVRILATSREPLRVEGEHICRLGPLESPPLSEGLTSAEALRFPAVQLFVERAAASHDGFELRDRDAPLVAEICHRLDGIPLAIELAAARVDVLGVRGLAARLEDGLQVLSGGRRAALPRHRTMRAALDWSYRLLRPPEQTLLTRLAIFAGEFTPAAAAAVVGDSGLSGEEIVDLLLELATKSLVATEGDDAEMRLRLLDTTRAYALEKLDGSGERDGLAQRHAEYYRGLFEQAEAEWETHPANEWLAEYGHAIDNLRAALDWAFSPIGDLSLGVALTAAAVPLWMHLSLLEECRSRVDQALGALTTRASPDALREMKLHAALGGTLMYTRSATDPEVGAAWAKTLELAERLGDIEYQLRAQLGLCSAHMRSGQHHIALALAQRFSDLATASSDPNYRLIGERLIGDAEYLGGKLLSGRRHIEHMLAHYTVSNRWAFIRRFQIDYLSAGRAFLARILWLQGFSDQAMRTAETSIEDARETGHVMTTCYVLALAACPIALWAGDLGAADRYITMLLDVSKRHAPALWEGWWRYYQGVLLINRGDSTSGSGLLHAGIKVLSSARFAVRFITFHGNAILALGRAGQIAAGLAEADESVSQFEQTEEKWLIADLLRSKGELLLLQAGPRAERAAEHLFREALKAARRPGALSLELRAAASLARLLLRQGRPANAVAVLQPVYDRVTEGFDTADLIDAKRLLDELNDAPG